MENYLKKWFKCENDEEYINKKVSGKEL